MPLRQGMIQLEDAKGDVGSVESGAGLGNDGIWVTWKGRSCHVRGRDIIRAVAQEIDPKGARRIPE